MIEFLGALAAAACYFVGAGLFVVYGSMILDLKKARGETVETLSTNEKDIKYSMRGVLFLAALFSLSSIGILSAT